MTKNGITTTKALGQENWKNFCLNFGRKPKHRIQYDYRHTDGELFSCVKNTLEECRDARDKWLEKK